MEYGLFASFPTIASPQFKHEIFLTKAHGFHGQAPEFNLKKKERMTYEQAFVTSRAFGV
jgi:hypothetical protein